MISGKFLYFSMPNFLYLQNGHNKHLHDRIDKSHLKLKCPRCLISPTPLLHSFPSQGMTYYPPSCLKKGGGLSTILLFLLLHASNPSASPISTSLEICPEFKDFTPAAPL